MRRNTYFGCFWGKWKLSIRAQGTYIAMKHCEFCCMVIDWHFLQINHVLWEIVTRLLIQMRCCIAVVSLFCSVYCNKFNIFLIGFHEKNPWFKFVFLRCLFRVNASHSYCYVGFPLSYQVMLWKYRCNDRMSAGAIKGLQWTFTGVPQLSAVTRTALAPLQTMSYRDSANLSKWGSVEKQGAKNILPVLNSSLNYLILEKNQTILVQWSSSCI